MLSYFLFFTFLLTSGGSIKAFVPCDSDEFCKQHYESAQSICLPKSRTCSNPFQEGCLRAKLGKREKRRVCNSDDKDRYGNPKFCDLPKYENYPEIRIYNGDRENKLFLAWIYQIVLMELVHVPVTVGLKSRETEIASFYSNDNIVHLSDLRPVWGGIKIGNDRANCSSTDHPCVHFLPEVWPTQKDEYSSLIRENIIEPPNPNGMFGKSGLYIPASTAKKYPSLTIWYGLSGEDKRELLAKTFKQPINWSEYCSKIAANNCLNPDNIATRPPRSREEGEKYFLTGSYKGYFKFTEENNCTMNPTNCTGALIGPSCESASPVESQLFFNRITGLSMKGPLSPNGGYTNDQRKEIWKAANATKSDVIMHWFAPDSLPIDFFGTEYSFKMIEFPPVNRICIDHRPLASKRCSINLTERLGDSYGSCMDEVHPLQSIIVKSIKVNNMKLGEVDRSPSYEILRNLKLTNLDMETIIGKWHQMHDNYNVYDPRDSVCEWVAQNIEELKSIIPDGYPREPAKESDFFSLYLLLAQIFGGFVAMLALLAFFLVWKYQKTKTMIFAQPIFLGLILIGYFLNSISGMLYAVIPTKISCIGMHWLFLIGYTLELVPVLVKQAAINKLVRSSKDQRQLSRQTMLLKVAGVVTIVLVYLVIWTSIDPPTVLSGRRFTDSDFTFEIEFKCQSKSTIWLSITSTYLIGLLVPAAVLAFKSRGVTKQVNESKSLAAMVYSRFLFACLRAFCYLILYLNSKLPYNFVSALQSYIYSFDSLFAMGIYIFPKIRRAMKHPEPYKFQLIANEVRKSTVNRESSELFVRNDDRNDDLRVLVCTGNLGNAEPTTESMEKWIPSNGQCFRVTPLENNRAHNMTRGTFDLIAIGMQEAFWKEKIKKSLEQEEIRRSWKKNLSEREIFNALEDENTVHIRKLIGDILGSEYTEIAEEERGEMRLSIWASSAVVDSIFNIKISGANTGIGNVLANKGGIVVSLNYGRTRISFVSAHLAAHEGKANLRTRCDNICSILKEGNTYNLNENLDVSISSHHTFLFGDLNFRTNIGENNAMQLQRAKRSDFKHAIKLIKESDYAGLYCYDELQQILTDGKVLMDFKTLPCNFPPTFKVFRQPGFSYQNNRIPSYTDRILFKSSEGLSDNLSVTAYEAVPDFITSDHKPIRGAFNITPNTKISSISVDQEYYITIQKMKCYNLRSKNSNIILDPYLMFLWDSSDLVVESNSYVRGLQSLWKSFFFSNHKKWPRTKHLPKTPNPYWKEDVILLKLRECEVTADKMLFVVVFNHDPFGKDNALGAMSISMKELVAMHEIFTEKSLVIDKTLTRGGEAIGTIEFEVNVAKNERLNRRRAVRGIKSFMPGPTRAESLEFPTRNSESRIPTRNSESRIPIRNSESSYSHLRNSV